MYHTRGPHWRSLIVSWLSERLFCFLISIMCGWFNLCRIIGLTGSDIRLGFFFFRFSRILDIPESFRNRSRSIHNHYCYIYTIVKNISFPGHVKVVVAVFPRVAGMNPMRPSPGDSPRPLQTSSSSTRINCFVDPLVALSMFRLQDPAASPSPLCIPPSSPPLPPRPSPAASPPSAPSLPPPPLPPSRRPR